MNYEIIYMALAGAGGIILGLVHFGGLWWTVQHLSETRRPAVLLLGSFIVRSSIVLGVLYFIMHGNVLRLLPAMAGFIISRQIFIRHKRIRIDKVQGSIGGEA